MGAVLSIPLIPLQIAQTAIASFIGASISSVFSNMISGIFGNMNSIATRCAYALLFLLNSIFSWLTLSSWLTSKLELLKYACKGEECTTFVAVQRINSSLGLLHLILAILLSYKYRRTIQNGHWIAKIFGYFSFLGLSFFLLPAGFWIWWGTYISPVLSFIFVFIGLILLVDAVHSWAETCIEHVEEEGDDERMWKLILVWSTIGMYLGAIGLSGFMFYKFAPTGCDLNQFAVTINIIFAIIISVLSIHPSVQEYNPKAGLAQSAMVAVYCTYLVLSAVTSEPDDKQCNPWARSGKTRGFATALGAGFTFVAIAYTTTRAASRAMIGGSDEYDYGSIALTSDARRDALERAVRQGSLPASALDDTEWIEEEDDSASGESDGYNYIIFHIVFLLATQYTASLLTINVESDPLDDFVPVGRSYYATWMKIISSWCCYALYSWSLVAPVLFPDRF